MKRKVVHSDRLWQLVPVFPVFKNPPGPRTAEGKARVSENASKPGLRSTRNSLDLATDTALPFEREEFLATL